MDGIGMNCGRCGTPFVVDRERSGWIDGESDPRHVEWTSACDCWSRLMDGVNYKPPGDEANRFAVGEAPGGVMYTRIADEHGVFWVRREVE